MERQALVPFRGISATQRSLIEITLRRGGGAASLRLLDPEFDCAYRKLD